MGSIYPSDFMKELNELIINNRNNSVTDIYNHWIISYNIQFHDTEEILNILDYIEKFKKLRKEEIEFLNNLER